MKIKIQDPEFGDFNKSGEFEMHLFEVIDGNLVHSTGKDGAYQRRAVVVPENVKEYCKGNAQARRAKIDMLK